MISEALNFTLFTISVESSLLLFMISYDNSLVSETFLYIITVEVQGASSVLSSIDETDITAYVDLSSLGEGTYTKKVIVKGTNPLAIYTPKRTEATVTISKKS